MFRIRKCSHRQAKRKPSSYLGLITSNAKKCSLRNHLLETSIPREKYEPQSSDDETPRCYLLQSPVELILQIAQHLEPRDIYALLKASRGLYTVLYALFCDEAPKYVDATGNTVLEWAAKKGYMTIIQRFQTEKRQKAFAAENKNRALYLAAEYGHLCCIEPLLSMGAEIMWIEEGGERMSIHNAAKKGHTAILELLLAKGADVNAKNSMNGTPLCYSVGYGHEACVRVLLEKGADAKSKFTLYEAMMNGDETITRLLLENGAYPSSIACKDAINFGQISTLKLLLEKGANIEGVDNKRRTALHSAVICADEEAVQLLLGKGANACALDKDGRRPLHFAAGAVDTYAYNSRTNSHYEIARLLLGKGVNDLDTDDYGKTALDYAKILPRRGSIITLLSRER